MNLSQPGRTSPSFTPPRFRGTLGVREDRLDASGQPDVLSGFLSLHSGGLRLPAVSCRATSVRKILKIFRIFQSLIPGAEKTAGVRTRRPPRPYILRRRRSGPTARVRAADTYLPENDRDGDHDRAAARARQRDEDH